MDNHRFVIYCFLFLGLLTGFFTPVSAGQNLLYNVEVVSSCGGPPCIEDFSIFNQSINFTGQYTNFTLELFFISTFNNPVYTMGIVNVNNTVFPNCLKNSTSGGAVRQNLSFSSNCILNGDGSYGQFRVKTVAVYRTHGPMTVDSSFDINMTNWYRGGQFLGPPAYGNVSDILFRLWTYEYAPPVVPVTCDIYLVKAAAATSGAERQGYEFSYFLCNTGWGLTGLVVAFGIFAIVFGIGLLVMALLRKFVS